MEFWKHAQEEEASFRGNCVNTLGEELKQTTYANYMGLEFSHDGNTPFNLEMHGKSVIDIGGGPVSLLLKVKNSSRKVVVDPMNMPNWVLKRYTTAEIEFYNLPGEIINEGIGSIFDEVWIYNCLQHAQDPKKIIDNAKKLGKKLRIFEWVVAPTNDAHPHTLKKLDLDRWIGQQGQIWELNGENGCFGLAYVGAFDIENSIK